MYEVMEMAFWATAEKLVYLIIPLIVIWVLMKIITSLFFSRT